MWWDGLGLWARGGVVALGVVSTVLVAVFLLKWASEWLAQPGLTGDKRAEDVGRTRTALLASIAGMIAVTGAVFTGLSYRLNRAGQITDRFSRAIEQLGATDNEGKPKIDVVLGGIYALERIARDSKDDHPQVVEVLTAYVREHAPYRPDTGPVGATTSGEQGQGDESATPDDLADLPRPRLATDVQAAMTVLARRDISQDRPNSRLRLLLTDLRELRLDAEEGGHLEGAYLYGARLQRANLMGVHLEGADFSQAHLEGAYLSGAHLGAAEFYGAHLEGAELVRGLFDYKTGESRVVRALYDDDTRWPESFDYRGDGARHVQEVDAVAQAAERPPET